jgi:transposase
VFEKWTHKPNRGQEDTDLKYTKDQRLDIGRRIYEGEISRFDAAEEYGIGADTARNYMRLYRAEHHLPARHVESNAKKIKEPPRPPTGLEDYEAMSKEELIHELVRARITEARLKKGYEVKGAGAQKEYVPLDSKSTK